MSLNPERQKKRPQRGLRAEAACVGTPGWMGLGEGRPAEVLALGLNLFFLISTEPT